MRARGGRTVQATARRFVIDDNRMDHTPHHLGHREGTVVRADLETNLLHRKDTKLRADDQGPVSQRSLALAPQEDVGSPDAEGSVERRLKPFTKAIWPISTEEARTATIDVEIAFEITNPTRLTVVVYEQNSSYLENEETKQAEMEKAQKMKEARTHEKRLEEKKRRADVMKEVSNIAHSESEEEASPKKKKKSKKEKKEKKEKKAKKNKKKKKSKKKKTDESGEESDEWVEVTADMRMEQAEREAREEQEMPGPALPEHLQARSQIGSTIKANYGKDMLKGEAAAMAAYAARGERIPRRGEIGLSSAEISEFEKVGYVMSGTRHKAMEATRLRKENQVLTAEEKRLLSGFSQEERKKKEEAMLKLSAESLATPLMGHNGVVKSDNCREAVIA
ncbi:unnamed protein product [Nippostrongylus brasiliensis]|uniref:UPF0396 protein CG6066 (inferred by orthology to a D. melanogaster protein) n=1 Tax=Nippostrongylus brasiliensis TaxID=27835 RepID=A0A0N4Y5S1_NIPBR|nr:unnamed protein product [Nippostrongylus brasiliensis]